MTVHCFLVPRAGEATVMVEVLQIETPSLGDRSYLVHDGAVALVIDPQRDIDRVTALAAEHGVRITHIAETHIHNDYLTGGLALARATGATYLVNEADPVAFTRTPVRDGDSIEAGAMRVRALATPGHTFTHLSYLVETPDGVAGVFTGGSLLYGATGRPDLLGPENTGALARAQYASAQRLARELPDATEVFPTHGFGSFCAAGQGQVSHSSTIGHEKLVNPALTLRQETYLDTLLAGLDAWPAYYAHMSPGNLAGPGVADLAPPQPASAGEIRRRIESGEWVIDLRDRMAFAAGFVPGSVCFTLGNSFASYVGWAVPWGAPVTLLGETPEQVADAQRELARIGIDRLAAAAAGQPADWSGGQPLASIRLVKFGDLADRVSSRPAPVVLDVRRRLEWAEGHVAGAIHIPFPDLPARLADVPPGEVWVHCQSGYRAMFAASLLAARGRDAVSVNDHFSNAAPAGLVLEYG
jgi:hydroxyacylglutathione hydrolase